MPVAECQHDEILSTAWGTKCQLCDKQLGEYMTAKLCGFCYRKIAKRALEPRRKLYSHNHPCEHCPAYYAKWVVRYK